MTPDQCQDAICIEAAYQFLREKLPSLPDSIHGAARWLRQREEFRGLTREREEGWEATFRDPTDHRYYHGYAPNNEDAVILAACRWKRIELDQAVND